MQPVRHTQPDYLKAMPPRSKGKGRSSKRKAPVDDVDEEEEEFDKLVQWDLEAWRRFG